MSTKSYKLYLIEKIILEFASVNLYQTQFHRLMTNVWMAKCTAKVIINVEQMANVFYRKSVTEQSKHFWKKIMSLSL